MLHGIDPKTKVFKEKPPCELIIIDPQGRRVGYDPRTGTSYNEIPDAFYESTGLEDAETGDPGQNQRNSRFLDH